MIPQPVGGEPSLLVWHTHAGRNMPSARVRNLALNVLADEEVDCTYVGIVLSREAHVHELNREFLGHDYPTDVLSFPISEPGQPLEGEVYVDLDTAAREAPRFGVPFRTEAARYVIHGLLHLAGYDDSTDEEKQAMRQLENRYLARYWGSSPG